MQVVSLVRCGPNLIGGGVYQYQDKTVCGGGVKHV